MTEKKKSRMERILELEARLSEYEGADKVIHGEEYKRLVEEERVNKKIVAMKSGIQQLDEKINGFEGGELTTVSGFTGNGKTLLCQTFTRNFSNQNVRSLWFPFETSNMLFIRQMMEDGALVEFYTPTLLIDSSIKWVFERIMESKIKYDTRAVFIDHLHYIIPLRSKDKQGDIGHVMRQLKKYAVNLNLSIFLLCHMTKTKIEREPELGDIRDSGFIEAESDNVFYVWRKTNPENEAVIKIAKNRREGVLNAKINIEKVGKFLYDADMGQPWEEKKIQ